MHWFKRIGMAALIVLMAVSAVSAQAPAPKQPPPQEPTTPTEPAPPPVNQAEEDDYKAFFEAPRDQIQKQVELGEAFLTKYPDSRYRSSVYTRLVSAYFSLGDVDKLFVTAEKALEINPDNVDVLSLVSYAVPRRIGPDDLDKEMKLKKVEEYSKHCVEVLNAIAKPETLTEEEFARAKNDKLAMAHSGLGMINYHRQNFAGMAAEFEQATQLTASPDPSDFYLLGIALRQLSRFGDAATAFGKCAASPWQLQDRCKQEMADAQKKAAVQPK